MSERNTKFIVVAILVALLVPLFLMVSTVLAQTIFFVDYSSEQHNEDYTEIDALNDGWDNSNCENENCQVTSTPAGGPHFLRAQSPTRYVNKEFTGLALKQDGLASLGARVMTSVDDVEESFTRGGLVLGDAFPSMGNLGLCGISSFNFVNNETSFFIQGSQVATSTAPTGVGQYAIQFDRSVGSFGACEFTVSDFISGQIYNAVHELTEEFSDGLLYSGWNTNGVDFDNLDTWGLIDFLFQVGEYDVVISSDFEFGGVSDTFLGSSEHSWTIERSNVNATTTDLDFTFQYHNLDGYQKVGVLQFEHQLTETEGQLDRLFATTTTLQSATDVTAFVQLPNDIQLSPAPGSNFSVSNEPWCFGSFLYDSVSGVSQTSLRVVCLDVGDSTQFEDDIFIGSSTFTPQVNACSTQSFSFVGFSFLGCLEQALTFMFVPRGDFLQNFIDVAIPQEKAPWAYLNVMVSNIRNFNPSDESITLEIGPIVGFGSGTKEFTIVTLDKEVIEEEWDFMEDIFPRFRALLALGLWVGFILFSYRRAKRFFGKIQR